MTKRILCVLLTVIISLSVLFATAAVSFAENGDVAEDTADTAAAENGEMSDGAENVTLAAPETPSEEDYQLKIKDAVYDAEKGTLTVSVKNAGGPVTGVAMVFQNYDESAVSFDAADYYSSGYSSFVLASLGEIGENGVKSAVFHPTFTDPENMPAIPCIIQYSDGGNTVESGVKYTNCEYGNIFDYSSSMKKESNLSALARQTGFYTLISGFSENWKSLIMIAIACVLLYLAIGKGFEPLLLIPIAFGMLLTNLPGAEMFHETLFSGGHVHWDMFGGGGDITPGLIDYLYLGVKLGIYPCLIFVGVGAMTDFAPLIANPKSLLLGAAAQLGIFLAFGGAIALGFTSAEAGSIGIIGGADGPTAIFVTSLLAPELLGPIAVAAYSYMALVPVIQPPIMKLLTTKEERKIKMTTLRPVSKKEKIIFPIAVTAFVAFLIPSAAPLVGSLMLGNLLRECGVADRLSKTAQNELMNIVTIFLGISVGATATAKTFLSLKTLGILAMGVCAFAFGTAGGVLLAKFMNLFLKKDKKINPLIGSAGVSAVPMAARVSQVVGQKEDPSNFLLMHAMGPNVAGVIGSAIAAGVLIALFG